MIGFDNWFTLEKVFGHKFSFSNAEIINAVANGLRGELVCCPRIIIFYYDSI